MGLQTATAGMENKFKELLKQEAKRGTAIFVRALRVVEERDSQGDRHPLGHPLDCEVVLLDGKNEGEYESSFWISDAGMLNKMDLTAGGRSAGQLEIYGKNWLGLTALDDDQRKLADAMYERLGGQEGEEKDKVTAKRNDGVLHLEDAVGSLNPSSGGAETKVAAGTGGRSSDGSKFDDDPPF